MKKESRQAPEASDFSFSRKKTPSKFSFEIGAALGLATALGVAVPTRESLAALPVHEMIEKQTVEYKSDPRGARKISEEAGKPASQMTAAKSGFKSRSILRNALTKP